MGVKIVPINEKDGHALLEFERENRSYFEETCLSRGDNYYEEHIFNEILRDLIKEQQ